MTSPMNSPSTVVQSGWKGFGRRDQNSHFQVWFVHTGPTHKHTHNYTHPYAGVLVANKTDLPARRVVGEADGRKFAAEKGLQYFECSAVSPQCCAHWSREQARHK